MKPGTILTDVRADNIIGLCVCVRFVARLQYSALQTRRCCLMSYDASRRRPVCSAAVGERWRAADNRKDGMIRTVEGGGERGLAE